MLTDKETIRFLGSVLGILALASIAGALLARSVRAARARELVRIVNTKLRLWWVMCAVFAVAMLTGGLGSIIVFGLTSFMLLREFITITPTRRGDHHALFWVFFVILPMQYYLLAIEWYGLFIILVPVYAFLFLPLRMAVAGDPDRFMERAAKIQWSLMLCVYCVSHAPALLKLDIPGHEGAGARLLFFLVLVVQVNDLVHEFVDRWCGSKPYAPRLTEERTWQGLLAGAAVSTGFGTVLFWGTPFSVSQAAAMSLLAALLGTGGKLCYHAIRRDRQGKGVVVVESYRSMMERVISLCVAAPIFFHMTRYYFVAGPLKMF